MLIASVTPMRRSAITWELCGPDRTVPRIEPDAWQAEVIAGGTGVDRVIGAPGTGKTATLLEAVVAAVAAGAKPAGVLVVASDRDAVNRLRDALALRLGGGEAPRVATMHSVALDLATRAQQEGPPLRLLSGGEEERAVRDIIDGTVNDPTLRAQHQWPAGLQDAVRTNGFAREVRAAFAASRALGLSGDEVSAFGRVVGDEAWAAVGPVLDAYLEAQAGDHALDYGELMFRAVAVARDPEQRLLLSTLTHVFVDDYQDADRMQTALLRAMATAAAGLQRMVVFGTPDVTVLGFRGADTAGLRDFPEHFAAIAARHGGVVREHALLAQHRYGPAIAGFASALHRGLVPAGFDAQRMSAGRAAARGDHADELRLHLYDDVTAEASHIASRIRELTDVHGVGYDEIAVITRNVGALGVIERALRAADVPAARDVREQRLVDQPAVRSLLAMLAVVAERELRVDPLQVRELLTSEAVDLDPSELRLLARALRAECDATSSGDALLAQALVDGATMAMLDPHTPGRDRLVGVARLLRAAHERVQAGATPHEVLWELWDGTDWPGRLEAQALAGSPEAHRDLDAVCELFDIADRAVQRRQGRAGVSAFVRELQAQEVPSHTLAGRGFRGPVVQCITAHRAKGRSWRHVFVAGVTDGVWPDVRRRAAILDPERLTPAGLTLPRGRQARIEDERRLLYVACTRASDGLYVSGVAGEGAEAPQCSRFLEPFVGPANRIAGRPRRIDSAGALLASLRRTVTDPAVSAALRAHAVDRLRSLRTATDGNGRPLFPEADPDTWWGARPVTANAVPVTDPNAPLYVRGSSVDRLRECSLSWFFEQRAKAEVERNTALGFGSAIHALADALAHDEVPADAEVLAGELQRIWAGIGYDSAWQSRRDFEQARLAIGRLLAWQSRREQRLVGTEVAFDTVVDIVTPAGPDRLHLRGSIDRVEIADDGGVVVFDFKTGRTAPTKAKVADHGQLAFYQYVVGRGTLAAAITAAAPDAPPAHPAGAELVHLRIDAGATSALPKTQAQAALPCAGAQWEQDVLAPLVATVRTEAFVATKGDGCTYCAFKVACPVQPQGRVESA